MFSAMYETGRNFSKGAVKGAGFIGNFFLSKIFYQLAIEPETLTPLDWGSLAAAEAVVFLDSGHKLLCSKTTPGQNVQQSSESIDGSSNDGAASFNVSGKLAKSFGVFSPVAAVVGCISAITETGSAPISFTVAFSSALCSQFAKWLSERKVTKQDVFTGCINFGCLMAVVFGLVEEGNPDINQKAALLVGAGASFANLFIKMHNEGRQMIEDEEARSQQITSKYGTL